MSANPSEIEVLLGQFVNMNVLLWNCRGALNSDFKRRIFEMAINHRPSILLVIETRLGGDRATKLLKGCLLMVLLLRRLLAMLEVCGFSGN